VIGDALTFHQNGPGAPRVALLTSRWGGRDETSWALRQIAGALALSAEVHVVTPQGSAPRMRADGLFTVHELGTMTRTSEIKRLLALTALARGAKGAHQPLVTLADHREASTLGSSYEALCRDLDDPWRSSSETIARVHPDLAVIADCRQVGALEALDSSCPEVPVMLVPLGRWFSGPEPVVFSTLLERARCGLVFTEYERLLFARICGPHWPQFVGLPITVNESVKREPNAYLGGEIPYTLVVTKKSLGELSSMGWFEFLRSGLSTHRLGISAAENLMVYDGGLMIHRLNPVERGSDLLRLIAWSTATLDLEPGELVGLRSLQALHFGVPIVVPADSVAQEHAERGGAGLWFDGPGELIGCVDAIFDPEVRGQFGAGGMKYAQEHYGATAEFVKRIGSAVELTLASGYSESPVSA
jgi:hypothetical protein